MAKTIEIIFNENVFKKKNCKSNPKCRRRKRIQNSVSCVLASILNPVIDRSTLIFYIFPHSPSQPTLYFAKRVSEV